MKPAIRIGPAGWSYPDWHGVVYPRAAGSRFDPLAYLAGYFDLIEINSTFYRVPTARTCASWARRTAGNRNFRFTIKLHRDFTHAKTAAGQTAATAFKTAIEPIVDDGKLGSLLVQFPWSYRNSGATRRYLLSLAKLLAPLPTAVEVRHGSWGSDTARRFFRDNGISLCGIDQPLIGDSLGPTAYEPGSALLYFRLHGRNRQNWFRSDAGRDDRYDYLYSRDELVDWRERIENVPAGVERLFVVLNNHFRGQAVANALELRSMLAGRPQDAPPELVRSYPQLRRSLQPSRPPGTPKRGTAQMNLFPDPDPSEGTGADDPSTGHEGKT